MRLLLLLAAAPAFLTANVETQSPPLRPATVYFYSEPGFRGDRLVLHAGATISNLTHHRDGSGRRWNDRISSIRIEGRARVVLLADTGFRGERLEITRDVRDLTAFAHGPAGIENWDDRISSLRILDFERNAPGATPIRSQREADRIIHATYLDLLGREPDYDGLQNYRRRLLEQGWDEENLRSAIRRSDEFRKRDPEDIVRRVFQEVLGREPQTRELDSLRRSIREKGWSEGEVKAELRRLPEARERVYREIIQLAYLDVLGREPDADGLTHYLGLMRDQHWTDQRVRSALLNSEEARRRR